MTHPDEPDDIASATQHALDSRDAASPAVAAPIWRLNHASVSESAADLGGFDPLLMELVEEATKRILGGEAVDVDKIAEDHPEWADALRSLLPAMRGLAEFAEDSDDLSEAGQDEEGRTVFGNFRILREIGRGGMGVVYEAEQIALKRRVALKILPQASAMDPRSLQRFELEAQVAGWLQHSRIVPVYDVGRVRGVPYYAMQFIEGGSLADLIGELRHLVNGGLAAGNPPSQGLGAVAAGINCSRVGANPPTRAEVEAVLATRQ